MIYLDSSVALAHLLAEDRFPPDILWDQPVVSSRLLECEVWNRINAHQLQDSHGAAVRDLIGRIAMIEMIGPVLTRPAAVSRSAEDIRCHSPVGA
jgi:uncharacterized protein